MANNPQPASAPETLEGRGQDIIKDIERLKKLREEAQSPAESPKQPEEQDGAQARQLDALADLVKKARSAGSEKEPAKKSERVLAHERGNALFKEKNYRAAIEAYMAAVKLGCSTAMFNVAACYCKLYGKTTKGDGPVDQLFFAMHWLMEAGKHGYSKDENFSKAHTAVARELLRRKSFDFDHEAIWEECGNVVPDGRKEYTAWLIKNASSEDQFQIAERWARKCLRDDPAPTENLYERRIRMSGRHPDKKQLHLGKALDLALELKNTSNGVTSITDLDVLMLMCDLGRFDEAETWAKQNKVARSDRKQLKQRLRQERKKR